MAAVVFSAATVGLNSYNRVEAEVTEGSIQADVGRWRVFAYEQALGLAMVEQVAYDLQVVQAFIADVWAQEVAWAEQQRQDQLEAERQAAQAAQVVEQTPQVVQQTAPVVGNNSGGISQSQFEALAMCEHGGTNGSLYGYYSIMDPRAGSLSKEEQQAWAQDIYANHGASAWGGCAHTLGG